MSLTLAAAIDRSLVRSDAISERYLMLTIGVPEGAVRRLPLNLALIVDASGSMTGEKLERAKEAAAFAVRHLTAADRVAVVAYDDEVRVVAPSTLLAPAARADLLRRIGGIGTGGMTNLSGGWLTGCQEIAAHQSGNSTMDRAIVLTDGLANVGIIALEERVEHARQLRSRGITTSTMGVGADFNEELLEAMARHGGGRFQYVETAKHIPDCVQGELGEIAQVYARRLALDVELPRGVRVVGSLNDDAYESTARGVRVHVGDLLAGDTRKVLLHLSIDRDGSTAVAGTGGLPLTVQALALYTDTATGQGTEQTFPSAHLRYASLPDVDRQRTDEAVASEVALLLAAKAKEDAARLSRQGEHDAAAGALRQAQASLAAAPYGAANAPGIAAELSALGRLADAAGQGMDESQRKELHYQSYLTRSARKRHDQKT